MLNKKTILSASILLLMLSNMSATADIAKYNYDKSITNKQIGVDVQAVIDCGYDYANPNCQKTNTGSTGGGYEKNSKIIEGAQDARNLNNGGKLNTPTYNQKQIGFGSIDQHNVDYGNTRDIKKQQEILGQTYGQGSTQAANTDLTSIGINSLDSTGVNTANTNTNLTNTYNTNKLSNAEGNALKNKCLLVNPNRPAGVGPQDDRYYLYNDVQCLSVRTVALANDNAATSGMAPNDPLRNFISKTSQTNNNTNNKVINVNTTASNTATANQQAYSCEQTLERKNFTTTTCQSNPIGRQQLCTQKLTVMCGGSSLANSRRLPECIPAVDKSTIKLASGSTRSAPSFNVTDSGFSMSERFQESSSARTTNIWRFTFTVNNPSLAYMTLTNIYYDNIMTVTFNGTEIGYGSTSSNAGKTLNYDMRPLTKLGLNTLEIKLVNNGGPARADFNVKVDPETFRECDCREAWVTTCDIKNVELTQ